jgi:hypothetical protein
MLEWIKAVLCPLDVEVVLDPNDLEVPLTAPAPPPSRIINEGGKVVQGPWLNQ